MAMRAGWNWPALEIPEVRKDIMYLWRWYCDISQGRNGILNYLSWCEIKAWSDLTNNRPNEWEISAIRAIDRGYIND